jgi:tetratricopeptide (TPR) repeat protein
MLIRKACKYSFLALFFLGLCFPSIILKAEDKCEEAGRLVRRGVDLADASDEEAQLYKKALELCPNLVEANFNLGLIEFKKGHEEEAIALFEKALEKERRKEFLLALAEVRLKTADPDSARQLYEEVLDKDRSEVRALQGLAVIYEKTDRIDRALKYLKKAQEVDERNALTYFNLGVLYEKMEKSEEALKAYKRSLDLDGANYSTLLFSGLLNKKMHRYEAALKNLTRATELNGEDAAPFRALGVIYDKLGENDRAELAFSRAVELDKSDLDSKINLAISKIRKNSEIQAEELLIEAKEKLLQNDPHLPRLLGVLGWAQLELGKYDLAEKSLKESLKLNPVNSAAHRNLGLLFERTGRAVEAKEEFDAAAQSLASKK